MEPREPWRNTPDACASADAVMADEEEDPAPWSEPNLDLAPVGVDGIEELDEELMAECGRCIEDGVALDECSLKLSKTSISSFKRHSSKQTNPRRSDIFLLAQPKQ